MQDKIRILIVGILIFSLSTLSSCRTGDCRCPMSDSDQIEAPVKDESLPQNSFVILTSQ